MVVTSPQSEPTPAIRKLAAVPGWKVVVVGTGDLRAVNWTMDGVEFLDKLKMSLLGSKLFQKIPSGNQGCAPTHVDTYPHMWPHAWSLDIMSLKLNDGGTEVLFDKLKMILPRTNFI